MQYIKKEKKKNKQPVNVAIGLWGRQLFLRLRGIAGEATLANITSLLRRDLLQNIVATSV